MRKFEVRFKNMSKYAIGDLVDIDDLGNLHVMNKVEKTCNLSCNAREWVYIQALEKVEDVHKE